MTRMLGGFIFELRQRIYGMSVSDVFLFQLEKPVADKQGMMVLIYRTRAASVRACSVRIALT